MPEQTPNPYEELDEIRGVVNDYPSLQKTIQSAAESLFRDLLAAHPVPDTYAKHQEIAEPVKFNAGDLTYALDPRHPFQIWRGVQVILVDPENRIADRKSVLMIYSRVGPDAYEWRILKPGTEAELSKKIVGRSRLYYYPEGDSKTRWAAAANKGEAK